MTCRHVLLALLLAGCATDVPLLEVTGTATHAVKLEVPTDSPPDDAITYRWEISLAPDGSRSGNPRDGASSMFIPDLRGDYLVDRWVVADLSERLSYRVAVSVTGIAPNAAIVGANGQPVGTPIVLDGTESRSPENIALTYRWRLASRPANSQAELSDVTSDHLSVLPDVLGEYRVELNVFDGALWSEMPATAFVFGQ